MNLTLKASPHYNPNKVSNRRTIIILVFVAVVILAIILRGIAATAIVGGILLFLGISGLVVSVMTFLICKYMCKSKDN